MKLKRTFLDIKRLACICINPQVRNERILDFIKCFGKPLQDMNAAFVSISKSASDYVLYNGQKLSLKTFVDDYYDLEGRGTLIEENRESGFAFSGYTTEDGYALEVDPNENQFSGYYDWDTEEWILEDPVSNPPLSGYILFDDGTALIDVDDEYITDKYNELIYTSDDVNAFLQYAYFLEGQVEDGLIIYLREDIYNVLTQEQLDTLYYKLGKFIIAPLKYKIDKI